MRPLTPNEIRLVWITGLFLLGLMGVYGGGWILQTEQRLDFRHHQLQRQRAEGDRLLQQQALWEARSTWLKRYAPACEDEDKSRSDLLDSSVEGAQAHDLQVTSPSLGETDSEPGLISHSANLTVEGTLESLCRWLSDLQTPESFSAVSSFSLQPGQEENSVLCNLTIKRFYRENR